MSNTYWGANGKYNAAADALHKLVPVEGACEFARGKNKALDKFRRAVNCYHDLYNNGLYNRRAEFRQLFGFGAGRYETGRYGRTDFSQQLYDMVEVKMDEFVVLAAFEQDMLPLVLAAVVTATAE